MTKMVIFIMEILKMIRKTEKEKLNLKMEIFLKENFKMIKYQELENIYF